MHERLKQLRKELNLTQQEFADKIHVSRGALATYETGRNEPIDAIIALICQTFHVNENWLRTGEGEIFMESAQEDQLFTFMGDVMQGAPDFRRQLLSVLSRMTPEEWTLLEKKAWELVDEMKKTDPEGPAE